MPRLNRLRHAALLLALSCSACGQKGPLYIPAPAGAIVTRPAPNENAQPPDSSPPAGAPAVPPSSDEAGRERAPPPR
ncbi:MAG: lipoprotein [Gammaproteobacteria bacterium]|nr:lipoprotein [Gammaproteobacteria bacterium]